MTGLFSRLRAVRGRYPGQFWLLFWGLLISSVGGSLVWPFLTIYVRQQLQVPLTQVGFLITVNSLAGLAGLSAAGPAADRFGRKGMMLVSLLGQAVSMVAMSVAASLASWFVIMAVLGVFNPLYRVGSEAMVADLVGPEDRPSAYALLRMISNLGIALGPAIGGFLAVISYDITFYLSATASVVYAVLLWRLARETLPAGVPTSADAPVDRGYGPVLRDRPFLGFVAVFALAGMAYAMMMVLLPVYAKENYGVIESQYGFILATNAAMVVLFQYGVTRWTERRPVLAVMAVGSLFYAVGVGLVGFSGAFLGFWLSMVILTVGELILIPTAMTLTANLAPAERRGRYVGMYALAWAVAFGAGPVLGGALNDTISPQSIWYGATVLAVLAAAGFVALSRSGRLRAAGSAPA